MRFLTKATLSTLLATLIIGCTYAPNTPKIVIDQNLPTIKEIRTLSDMNEVGLEWSPIHEEKIVGYHIYRSTNGSSNFKKVATIKDRYASHYVDTNLKPQTIYAYTMSTYSKTGLESTKSPLASISTKQLLEPVSFIQAITNLPKRVKIIWRPHQYTNTTSYLVQKREIGKLEWKNAKEIKGRLSAEYIDLGLENNEAYEYRVFAKTNQGVLSKPSKIVSAKTKSLPFTVQNIQASNNIPKKIVITWNKILNDDIAYYKIYKSPTSMLLYTLLAKTKENRFEDLLNSNGETRYYKITAVDRDGLESEKQDNGTQGQTLPSPATPRIIEAKSDGYSVELHWVSGDNRTTSYTVIKEFDNQKQVAHNIQNRSFIDRNIQNGVKYSYSIIGIDEYGLSSQPSKQYNIIIPNPNETREYESSYKNDLTHQNNVQTEPTDKEHDMQNQNNSNDEIIIEDDTITQNKPISNQDTNSPVEIY